MARGINIDVTWNGLGDSVFRSPPYNDKFIYVPTFMTNVILDRFKTSANGTFGMLTLNGDTLCFTCELPWVDNQPDVSCIPPGTYPCMAYSSTHHPDVWAISNVPGRSGILIHNGNTENDSNGCIIVGNKLGKLNGMDAVLESNNALNMLRSILPDMFTLTVNGVPS